MTDPFSEVARYQLAHRLDRAVSLLDDPACPLVVVDLDAFDANAADLARRAGDKPLRLASKSVRVPALIRRALQLPGFKGVLAYSLREALWLAGERLSDDIVMGYPSVDGGALRMLTSDAHSLAAVTLMVDDVAQLDRVDQCRVDSRTPVQVAIDIDAGLRLGNSHVGPKRSPLYDVEEVLAFARHICERPGFELVGVMTYEGQVAGLQDAVPSQKAKSAVVRRIKGASVSQLRERRAEIARGLAVLTTLRFWNAGGSGSIESSAADPIVTEVAAGSGLLVPTLFDHYESFRPLPAAYFAVPVLRRPNDATATVAGGGFVASGPSGKDRLPTPWAPPGLRLTGLEGAGEVQTPLTGVGARNLRVGDNVWFRHAKAGELAEHTNLVHLLRDQDVVESVPSYRGLGHAW